jgi:hypothetical protein
MENFGQDRPSGVSTSDNTCLLQVQNEGHIFLVYYDFKSKKALGVFYVELAPMMALPCITSNIKRRRSNRNRTVEKPF